MGWVIGRETTYRLLSRQNELYLGKIYFIAN